MGRKCEICYFLVSVKGKKIRETKEGKKFVKIQCFEKIEGREEYNMKTEIERDFEGLQVKFGQYICDLHVRPLSEGVKKYSKNFLPLLHETQGLEWNLPSSRGKPYARPEPQEKTMTDGRIRKRLKDLEEVAQNKKRKVESLRLEVKELKKTAMENEEEKLLFLQEIACLKEKITSLSQEKSRIESQAPIDTILKTIQSPKEGLMWYGVMDLSDFHLQVRIFLCVARNSSYAENDYRLLQRTMIQLRNGF